MRGVFTLLCSAVLISCLPAYSQDAETTTLEQAAAIQKKKDSYDNLVATLNSLKGLNSIVLGVSYVKNYKAEIPNVLEQEISHTLISKLRAAGFTVVSREDFLKQNRINWDHKTRLNTPQQQGLPLLQMNITTYKWVDNDSVVTVDTKLSENGCLIRAPKLPVLLTSWTSDIDAAVVETAGLRKHFLKVSIRQIDVFISTWARQNCSR